MRTDLSHLPALKQREIDRVVEMIFQGFREATQNATGRRQKSARILKIILFGSYARGDWVDAPLDANQYKSDYDILIIVNQDAFADRADYWEDTEQRLVDAYLYEKAIRTPANFIVHSLHEVNDALAHGRLIFMEIVKDGIALYQSDDRDLATFNPKTPEEIYHVAKDYFEEYIGHSQSFYRAFQDAVGHGDLKIAAFQLHQATEPLYQCVLLVLTLYTPFDHNILFLRSLAEGVDHSLFDVWPRGTRAERAMYQKLKDAYRKARYSRHYQISREELDWLGAHVEELGRKVHEICTRRLDELQKAIPA
ncbi:HEPN domain-containing protein [Sphingomonas histidinilytica]|uniref:nucleotidyltransferase domain-containing protein n=1 Tax=Rhizorhabdus histidinilytica TaxID=439228 RepID=UPI001AD97343|nr:nucleotidyltransferase domain-containing protein [Rhizorhabdus histidinilytica]MBO9375565.1 HEPN domain-containing protein [Rhizorhabdus histidinilytica]